LWVLTSYTYDIGGRLTKVSDGRANATTFEYDDAYRLIRRTDALGNVVSYGYDAMSQLTSRTDELGRTTSFAYDDAGHLTKITRPAPTAGAQTVVDTFTYDAVGNLVTHVDGDGRATRFSYDSLDRLVERVDPDGHTTRLEYDAVSRLLAITDPAGQRYEYAYDVRGLLTEERRGARHSVLHDYDQDQNEVARVDSDGNRLDFTYDTLDRLTRTTEPSSAQTTYTYDALSRLVTATNVEGTVSFTYDIDGRLSGTTGVDGVAVAYSYDQSGNRTRMDVGPDRTVTAQFDALDRLTTLIDRGTSIGFAYDQASNLTSTSLPNGIVSTLSRDALGRIASVTHGQTGVSFTYERDGEGNVTRYTASDGVHTLGYDPDQRLISADHPTGQDESYSYDPAGNRTSSQWAAAYSYQDHNRLVSAGGVTLSYDGRGNVVTRADASGSWQYSWDARNRLRSAAASDGRQVSYRYDALGRRVGRQVTGSASSTYTYDGANPVRELVDGAVRDLIVGPGVDSRLADRDGSQVVYYLKDQLGSTVALVDSAGAVVERLTRDSFGVGAASARTRFDFAGRERDPLTGLMDLRARWYDPTLGRFLSEDPIGVAGGHNLYGYVGSNPLRYVDPFGLDPIIPRSVGPIGQVDFQTGNLWLDSTVYGAGNIVVNGLGMIGNAILAPAQEVLSWIPPDVLQGLAYSPYGLPEQLLEGAVAASRYSCAASNGEKATYEILDGVRRSKAAEIAGQPSIRAEVAGSGGKIIDVPLDALRSPHPAIDTAGQGLDRWLNALGQTMRGSEPPPIIVQPGSRGTPIPGVVVE
jgi:RHS repeat-associated protein